MHMDLGAMTRDVVRGRLAVPERWAIVYGLHSVIAAGSRLDIVTATAKGNGVASFKLWFGGAGD
jgi:hypothetical protein